MCEKDKMPKRDIKWRPERQAEAMTEAADRKGVWLPEPLAAENENAEAAHV